MFKEIFHLFFPRTCYGCGCILNDYEQFICEYCKFNLPITNYHKIKDNPAEEKFLGKVPIYKATSFLHYNKKGIVQSIIHNLKYKQCLEIGVYFGRMAALRSDDFFKDIDYIIPVPLHKKKLKQRGYNQSDMIAEGISQVTKIPINRDLSRTRYTETQTRKDQYERYKNTHGNFELIPSVNFDGKYIMLVDDVLTTGSTLEACVHAIINVQPSVKVCVFTLGIAGKLI